MDNSLEHFAFRRVSTYLFLYRTPLGSEHWRGDCPPDPLLLAAVSSARHSLSYSVSQQFGTARGGIFSPPTACPTRCHSSSGLLAGYLRPATACPTRCHSSSELLAAVSSARLQPVLFGVTAVRDCSRRYLQPATACPTRCHSSSGLLAAISSARHNLSYSVSQQFGTARGVSSTRLQPVLLGVTAVRDCSRGIFNPPQPVLLGVTAVRDRSRRYLRPAYSLSYSVSQQFGAARGSA